MKRKEREHLKEDPFVNLVEKIVHFLRKYKKEITIGVSAAALILVILIVIIIMRSSSINKENELYAQALTIKNSETLTINRKIEELEKIKSRNGISATNKLFIANLYLEKGDIEGVSRTLAEIKNPRLKVINDQKQLLEAELLYAQDKTTEAIEKMNLLLADPGLEISKDQIVFRMATIQLKSNDNEAAKASFNKLITEYPNSFFANEARTFLEELED